MRCLLLLLSSSLQFCFLDQDITLSSTTPSKPICSPQQFNQTITKDGCSITVPLTKCQGNCPSESWYHDGFEWVEGRCSCCMPLKSSVIMKRVELYCPNSNNHVYVDIKVFTECICHYQPCMNANTTPGAAVFQRP
ncbi:mucin-6-like [Spea bombifrons]|uniref:mucin-6-like n=1 Tax=Spea bombifrons TaxID=233779 RepID=UPI00234BD677|nr:mucin-6-like [Spea bombifrons]